MTQMPIFSPSDAVPSGAAGAATIIIRKRAQIKGVHTQIAGRGGETGTTQRVLGSFLTWMAEKQSQVFVVATANNIDALPPELIRKGRFDEIFFVDLPDDAARRQIFDIQLERRSQDPAAFDAQALATAAADYSGKGVSEDVCEGV